jgi:hypothetical protein
VGLANAARSRVHPFLRKSSFGFVALLFAEAGCADHARAGHPRKGQRWAEQALAWILRFGFHVIAARATEDEQLGVRSDLGNRADEVHRPAAMRAGGRIPVLGRRARQVTRIGSLFREAGAKLGESLFTREFRRELRFETAAGEPHPQRSRPPLNFPRP